MKLIYPAKWIIVLLSAIAWVMAFGVLFAGGSASVNRAFLLFNLILLLAQISNAARAFIIGKKDIGIGLSACLALFTLLLYAIYIWNWNYAVKALTIGFE